MNGNKFSFSFSDPTNFLQRSYKIIHLIFIVSEEKWFPLYLTKVMLDLYSKRVSSTESLLSKVSFILPYCQIDCVMDVTISDESACIFPFNLQSLGHKCYRDASIRRLIPLPLPSTFIPRWAHTRGKLLLGFFLGNNSQAVLYTFTDSVSLWLICYPFLAWSQWLCAYAGFSC